MGHKRRKKDKLPDDVSDLTGDEIMEKVFPKKVVKKLTEVAHEGSPVRITLDTLPFDAALAALLERIAELPDSVLLGFLEAGHEVFRIESAGTLGASELRFTLQPSERLIELGAAVGASDRE